MSTSVNFDNNNNADLLSVNQEEITLVEDDKLKDQTSDDKPKETESKFVKFFKYISLG